MKHLVVLSGAGISAESGISTFRGQDGLWEGHSIEEVASPEGFLQNPKLVLDFYNKRRAQLKEVAPNAAHLGLKALEQHFKVSIITQNVDDLHERAGSKNVYHLHGKLRSVRTQNFCCTLPLQNDLNIGDTCLHGNQLRPDIVWFGEAVPMIEEAISICNTADVLLIIGTSLQVYPAASLMDYIPENCKSFYIDPGIQNIPNNITHLQTTATEGLKGLMQALVALR